MNKYSPNKKLETCLCYIEQALLKIQNSPEESMNNIRRYVKTFPNEPDYNLVQFGNLMVSSSQVREFYRDCGYKSMQRESDDKIWATYLRQVGYVARQLLKEK